MQERRNNVFADANIKKSIIRGERERQEEEVESQITGLRERARHDSSCGYFSVFVDIDARGRRVKEGRPSGFNLLTRYGDYAVLMTPWECIFAMHFFSTMACSPLSHASSLCYAHHPNSGLLWDNK